MTTEYDLFIRQEGKDLEIRKVDRPDDSNDEEYREAAFQAAEEVRAELGSLGMRHNVIVGYLDAPSEEELFAMEAYSGPWYTLDEVLGRS